MQFARYDSRDPLLQVIETSPNYSPTGAARLGRRSFESDLVSNWWNPFNGFDANVNSSLWEYDNAGRSPDQALADQRGNRQSIVAQGVAAAFRFPFGVVSKLGQGFGLIEGAGRKFFTGYGTNPHKVKELAEEMYNLFVEGDHKLVSDILDNTMTRGFENMEEGVDQFFNIHKDRSYREGNWMSKMIHPEFWLGDGMDAVEYMAAAAIPGLGVGGATAGITKGAAQFAGKQLLKKLGISGSRAIAGIVNTVFEAGMEARGIQKEMREQLAHQMGYNNYESAPSEMKREIDSKAGAAAARVFRANAALLLVPKYLETAFAGPIAKSATSFGRTLPSGIRKRLPNIGDTLEGAVDGKNRYETIQKAVRSGKIDKEKVGAWANLWRLGKDAGQGILTESFQENAQSAITAYEMRALNEREGEHSYWASIGENMARNVQGIGAGLIGDPFPAGSEEDEGAAATILGAVMGGAGSSYGFYKKRQQEKAMRALAEQEWKGVLDNIAASNGLLIDDQTSIYKSFGTEESADGKTVRKYINPETGEVEVDPDVISNIIANSLQNQKFFQESILADTSQDPAWREYNRQMAIASQAYTLATKGLKSQDIRDYIQYMQSETEVENPTDLEDSQLELDVSEATAEYMDMLSEIDGSISNPYSTQDEASIAAGYNNLARRFRYYIAAKLKAIDALDSVLPAESREHLKNAREDALQALEKFENDQESFKELYDRSTLPLEHLQQKLAETEDLAEQSALNYLIAEREAIEGTVMEEDAYKTKVGQSVAGFLRGSLSRQQVNERRQPLRTRDSLRRGQRFLVSKTALETVNEANTIEKLEAITRSLLSYTDLFDKPEETDPIVDELSLALREQAATIEQAINDEMQDDETTEERFEELSDRLQILREVENLISDFERDGKYVSPWKPKPTNDIEEGLMWEYLTDDVDRWAEISGLDLDTFDDISSLESAEIGYDQAKRAYEMREDISEEFREAALELLDNVYNIILKPYRQAFERNKQSRQIRQRQENEFFGKVIKEGLEIDEATSLADPVFKEILGDNYDKFKAQLEGTPTFTDMEPLFAAAFDVATGEQKKKLRELATALRDKGSGVLDSIPAKRSKSYGFSESYINNPSKASIIFNYLDSVIPSNTLMNNLEYRKLRESKDYIALLNNYEKLFEGEENAELRSVLEQVGVADKYLRAAQMLELYADSNVSYSNLIKLEKQLLKDSAAAGSPIAPSIQQLIAIRTALAKITAKGTGDLMNDSVFTEGFPGSGKSKVVAPIILAALQSPEQLGMSEEEILVTGATEASARIAGKALKGKEDAAITLAELLSMSDEKLAGIKLVIVDEAPALPNKLFNALKKKLEDKGIKLLLLGDPAQVTFNVIPTLDSSVTNSSYRTNILTSSYRTNVGPIANLYQKFRFARNEVDQQQTEANMSLEQAKQSNETPIGVLSSRGPDTMFEDTMAMLSRNNGVSKLVIVSNEQVKAKYEAEIASKGIQNVQVYTYPESNGLEVDEVYIDMNPSDISVRGKRFTAEHYNKGLFTAISRSTKMVLVPMHVAVSNINSSIQLSTDVYAEDFERMRELYEEILVNQEGLYELLTTGKKFNRKKSTPKTPTDPGSQSEQTGPQETEIPSPEETAKKSVEKKPQAEKGTGESAEELLDRVEESEEVVPSNTEEGDQPTDSEVFVEDEIPPMQEPPEGVHRLEYPQNETVHPKHVNPNSEVRVVSVRAKGGRQNHYVLGQTLQGNRWITLGILSDKDYKKNKKALEALLDQSPNKDSKGADPTLINEAAAGFEWDDRLNRHILFRGKLENFSNIKYFYDQDRSKYSDGIDSSVRAFLLSMLSAEDAAKYMDANGIKWGKLAKYARVKIYTKKELRQMNETFAPQSGPPYLEIDLPEVGRKQFIRLQRQTYSKASSKTFNTDIMPLADFAQVVTLIEAEGLKLGTFEFEYAVHQVAQFFLEPDMEEVQSSKFRSKATKVRSDITSDARQKFKAFLAKETKLDLSLLEDNGEKLIDNLIKAAELTYGSQLVTSTFESVEKAEEKLKDLEEGYEIEEYRSGIGKFRTTRYRLRKDMGPDALHHPLHQEWKVKRGYGPAQHAFNRYAMANPYVGNAKIRMQQKKRSGKVTRSFYNGKSLLTSFAAERALLHNLRVIYREDIVKAKKADPEGYADWKDRMPWGDTRRALDILTELHEKSAGRFGIALNQAEVLRPEDFEEKLLEKGMEAGRAKAMSKDTLVEPITRDVLLTLLENAEDAEIPIYTETLDKIGDTLQDPKNRLALKNIVASNLSHIQPPFVDISFGEEAVTPTATEETQQESTPEDSGPIPEENLKSEPAKANETTISNGSKIIPVDYVPLTNQIKGTKEVLNLVSDDGEQIGEVYINPDPLKEFLVVPNGTLTIYDSATGKTVVEQELNAEGSPVFVGANGRLFVVANINGQLIPFYQSSSGTSGKAQNNWYPFFGYTGSWLVKGSVEEDGSMNYSPEIDRVTKLLNENFRFPGSYLVRALNTIGSLEMNQFFSLNNLEKYASNLRHMSKTYRIKGFEDQQKKLGSTMLPIDAVLVALVSSLSPIALHYANTPKDLSEWFELLLNRTQVSKAKVNRKKVEKTSGADSKKKFKTVKDLAPYIHTSKPYLIPWLELVDWASNVKISLTNDKGGLGYVGDFETREEQLATGEKIQKLYTTIKYDGIPSAEVFLHELLHYFTIPSILIYKQNPSANNSSVRFVKAVNALYEQAKAAGYTPVNGVSIHDNLNEFIANLTNEESVNQLFELGLFTELFTLVDDHIRSMVPGAQERVFTEQFSEEEIAQVLSDGITEHLEVEIKKRFPPTKEKGIEEIGRWGMPPHNIPIRVIYKDGAVRVQMGNIGKIGSWLMVSPTNPLHQTVLSALLKRLRKGLDINEDINRRSRTSKDNAKSKLEKSSTKKSKKKLTDKQLILKYGSRKQKQILKRAERSNWTEKVKEATIKSLVDSIKNANPSLNYSVSISLDQYNRLGNYITIDDAKKLIQKLIPNFPVDDESSLKFMSRMAMLAMSDEGRLVLGTARDSMLRFLEMDNDGNPGVYDKVVRHEVLHFVNVYLQTQKERDRLRELADRSYPSAGVMNMTEEAFLEWLANKWMHLDIAEVRRGFSLKSKLVRWFKDLARAIGVTIKYVDSLENFFVDVESGFYSYGPLYTFDVNSKLNLTDIIGTFGSLEGYRGIRQVVIDYWHDLSNPFIDPELGELDVELTREDKYEEIKDYIENDFQEVLNIDLENSVKSRDERIEAKKAIGNKDAELADYFAEMIEIDNAQISNIQAIKESVGKGLTKGQIDVIFEDIFPNWRKVQQSVSDYILDLSETEYADEIDEISADTLGGLKAEIIDSQTIDMSFRLSDAVKEFLSFLQVTVVRNGEQITTQLPSNYSFIKAMQLFQDLFPEDFRDVKAFQKALNSAGRSSKDVAQSRIKEELIKIFKRAQDDTLPTNVNIFMDSGTELKARSGKKVVKRLYENRQLTPQIFIVWSKKGNDVSDINTIQDLDAAMKADNSIKYSNYKNKDLEKPFNIHAKKFDDSVELFNQFYRRADARNTFSEIVTQFSVMENEFFIANRNSDFNKARLTYIKARDYGIHQSIRSSLEEGIVNLHQTYANKGGLANLDEVGELRSLLARVKESNLDFKKAGVEQFFSLLNLETLLKLDDYDNNDITQLAENIKFLLEETQTYMSNPVERVVVGPDGMPLVNENNEPEMEVESPNLVEFLRAEQNGRLNELAEALTKTSPFLRNTSIRNADNKRVYRYTPSHFLYTTLKRIHSADRLGEERREERIPEFIKTDFFQANPIVRSLGLRKEDKLMRLSSGLLYHDSIKDTYTNRPTPYTQESFAQVIEREFSFGFLSAYNSSGSSGLYHQFFYPPSNRGRVFSARVSPHTKKTAIDSLGGMAKAYLNRPDLGNIINNYDKDSTTNFHILRELINEYSGGKEVLKDFSERELGRLLLDKLIARAEEALPSVMKSEPAIPHTLYKVLGKMESNGLLFTSLPKEITAAFKDTSTKVPDFEYQMWDKNDYSFKYTAKAEHVAPAFTAFYVNHYINSLALGQLAMGDPAFYKATEDDLVKRMQGPSATGQKGNTANVPQHYRVGVVDDKKLSKDQLREFLTGLSSEDIADELMPLYEGASDEITDAQGFMLPSRRSQLKSMFGYSYGVGNIHKPVHFEIVTRVVNGVKVAVPVYTKYSSVVLTDELVAKFPGLRRMRDFMERNNLDETVFGSGIKVGKPAQTISADTIWNPLQDEQSEELTIPEDQVLILSNAEYRLQHNPAAELNKGNAIFTQLLYFINTLEGNEQAAGEIYSALAWLFEDGLYKIDETVRGSFIRMMKDRLKGKGAETALELLRAGVSIQNPVIETKTISALAREFEKRTVGIRIAGSKLVLQSSYGMEVHGTNVDSEALSKGKRLQFKTDEFGRMYAEAIVPANMLSEDQLDAMRKGKSLFMTGDMFGYRIPSTGLHSAVPLRIVATYDTDTNVVIVPRELVPLHGSDFDVDSLFVAQREFVDGKPVGYKWDTEHKKYVWSDEQVNKIVTRITAAKKRSNDIQNKLDALPEEIDPDDSETIRLKGTYIADLRQVRAQLKKERMSLRMSYQNRIVENMMEAITHERNRKQMLAPISFSPIVKALNDLNITTAKGMDLNDFVEKARAYKLVQDGGALTGMLANSIKVLSYLSKAGPKEDGKPTSARIKSSQKYPDPPEYIDMDNETLKLDRIANNEYTWHALDAGVNAAIDNIKELLLPALGVTRNNGNVVAAMVGTGMHLTGVGRVLNTNLIKHLETFGNNSISARRFLGNVRDANTTAFEKDEKLLTLSAKELDLISDLSVEDMLAGKTTTDQKKALLRTIAFYNKMDKIGSDLYELSRVINLAMNIPNSIDKIDGAFAVVTNMLDLPEVDRSRLYSKRTTEIPIEDWDAQIEQHLLSGVGLNEGLGIDAPELLNSAPHIASAVKILLYMRSKIGDLYHIHSPNVREAFNEVLDQHSLDIKLNPADTKRAETEARIRHEFLNYIMTIFAPEVLNYPYERKVPGRRTKLGPTLSFTQDFAAKINKAAILDRKRAKEDPHYKPNTLLAQISTRPDPATGFPSVKLNAGADLSSDEIQELRQDFLRLKQFKFDESGNVEMQFSGLDYDYSEFQKDFLRHAIAQNGFRFAASSFSNILPPKMYLEIDGRMKTLLKVLSKDKELAKKFIGHFLIELAANNPDKITSRVNSKMKDWRVKVQDGKIGISKILKSNERQVIAKKVNVYEGKHMIGGQEVYADVVFKIPPKDLEEKWDQKFKSFMRMGEGRKAMALIKVFSSEDGQYQGYMRIGNTNRRHYSPIAEKEDYKVADAFNPFIEAIRQPEVENITEIEYYREIPVGTVVDLIDSNDPTRRKRRTVKITEISKNNIGIPVMKFKDFKRSSRVDYESASDSYEKLNDDCNGM